MSEPIQADGMVRFFVDVKVDGNSLAKMSPQNMKAFFDGIASAVSALDAHAAELQRQIEESAEKETPASEATEPSA